MQDAFASPRTTRRWALSRQALGNGLHTFLFLTAIALCGLVFGGVTAGQLNSGDAYVLQQQLQLLLDAASNHQLASVSTLWSDRFFRDLELLGLLWLFGISVLGLPLVAVAVFLRGFTVGFTASFTVLSLGWPGLWLSSSVIFLHQLLAFPALVVAGAAAIRFSGDLLLRERVIHGLTGRFLYYGLVFSVCALWMAGADALQAVLAVHVLPTAR